MEPGRELDALVAEKVMGYLPFGGGWVERSDGSKMLDRLKPYSTDIAAAWEVVEKLEHWMMVGLPGGYRMIFFSGREFAADSDTAPHAICLAALKAVGVEV